MCRRWHGAAFRTRCTIQSKDFNWIRGEDNLSRFHSSKQVIKTFYKTCGSSLVSQYEDDPEHMGLPLGGLDQDPGKRPIAHIYVKDKSPWHEITDDLPQFDVLPDESIEMCNS